MGKAAERRCTHRVAKLWKLAQSDPQRFDTKITALVNDWAKELRWRTRRLDRESATAWVQQAMAELQLLFGLVTSDIEETQAGTAELTTSVARVDDKVLAHRKGPVASVRGPQKPLTPAQLERLRELLLAKAREAQRATVQLGRARDRVHDACDHLIEELPARCCFELAQVIDRRMHRLTRRYSTG